jgi:hypothetical protein
VFVTLVSVGYSSTSHINWVSLLRPRYLEKLLQVISFKFILYAVEKRKKEKEATIVILVVSLLFVILVTLLLSFMSLCQVLLSGL